jgi:hypothetical protein
MRKSLLVPIAVALSIVVCALPAAGVGARSWSGNAAAIAYYRVSVARTNALPVLHDVEHGYYFLWDAGGTKGNFLLSWGLAKPSESYQQHVDGTYVVRMSQGKSVWETLEFTVPCTSGSVCASSITPLTFLVKKGAAYWGYDNSSNVVGCWNKATDTSAWIAKDFRVGSAWWYTYGDYRPMVKHGNVVVITETYPASYGATTTETDSINATTHLFKGSVLRISKSKTGSHPAYNYTVTETDPKAIPKEPTVHVCG